MANITTINSGDLITNSRADINNNFANLNSDKIETSVIDTDTTLAANSDSKIPTQKAVKAYVDTGGNVNASETNKGIVEEATDAEVTAGTATGGTGAKLFITPAKLATRLTTAYQTTLIYKSGVTTKTLSDSSTTQNIAHGLGVIPKRVRIFGSVKFSDTSTGVVTFVYDSASSNYVTMLYAESSTDSAETGSGIRLYGNSGLSNYQNGVVTVDVTNISIAWTKTGSPTVTWNLLWEAEG